MADGRQKLSIVLNNSREYALIREAAKKAGESVSEWGRKTLLAGVPSTLGPEMARDEATRAALNTAHEAFEAHEEAAAHPNIMPLGPVGTAQPAPVLVKPSGAKPLTDAQKLDPHPCAHLLRQFTPHWKPGSINGICQEQSQKGRTCNWGAAVAKDCPVFCAKVGTPGPGMVNNRAAATAAMMAQQRKTNRRIP